MSYVMPAIEPGDIVSVARGPGAGDWLPGIVTRVMDETLDCFGYVSSGWGHALWFRYNVRHVTDPWLQDPANVTALNETEDSGVFELRKGDAARRNEIKALQDQVAQLQPKEKVDGRTRRAGKSLAVEDRVGAGA